MSELERREKAAEEAARLEVLSDSSGILFDLVPPGRSGQSGGLRHPR
ncbi:hypothetical protein QW131_10905 [Roseibium salinum]|nr:hypothetical protein [Roseibium salinum]